MMGLDQDTFWAQSLREWDARCAGFKKMHSSDGADVTPMTGQEFEDLLEEYPDGQPLPGMREIYRGEPLST